jgi:hypothetical protein
MDAADLSLGTGYFFLPCQSIARNPKGRRFDEGAVSDGSRFPLQNPAQPFGQAALCLSAGNWAVGQFYRPLVESGALRASNQPFPSCSHTGLALQNAIAQSTFPSGWPIRHFFVISARSPIAEFLIPNTILARARRGLLFSRQRPNRIEFTSHL